MKPLFIHIPKTAGQSIHKALGMKNQPHRPLWRRKSADVRFVFSVVRNPYDRAVSLFHWYRDLHKADRKRTPHNAAMNMLARGCEDVNEFWTRFFPEGTLQYQRRYTPMMATQLSYLSDKGAGKVSLNVNRILRFESLKEDWAALSRDIRLRPLPHVNKSNHRDWQEELSEESRAVIAKLYAVDFEAFKYEV